MEIIEKKLKEEEADRRLKEEQERKEKAEETRKIQIKVWIYKGEIFTREFSQETNKK